MLKSLFCAAAALIGSVVGATAPTDWRGDRWRYLGIVAAVESDGPNVALVFRPYQSGD